MHEILKVSSFDATGRVFFLEGNDKISCNQGCQSLSYFTKNRAQVCAERNAPLKEQVNPPNKNSNMNISNWRICTDHQEKQV